MFLKHILHIRPYILRILILALSLLFLSKSVAQTDSVFWFVAPEICQHNSPNTFDRPIRLNFASICNYPVSVTITQPANSSFAPIQQTIPSNGDLTIDLTNWITMIENDPPFTVLTKGLLIETSGLVNLYYEIANGGVNPECYALKGRNALGANFLIPGQNEYNNGSAYSPNPYNRFDIVATTDNTQVTITTTQNVSGHSANTPFSINLNRGETYCVKGSSQQGTMHMHGSEVTANHPIAITLSDDLLNMTGTGGYDQTGDQIVPIDMLGTEYIAVKGTLSNDGDRVYILATEDNTGIYINGSTTPVTTINRKETYRISFSGNNALYVKTTNPVYAYQITGMGGELGAALLPQITCTGSKLVKYKRGTGVTLKLNLLVQAGGENDFTINGNSTLITASDFSFVPGNQDWKYASKDISRTFAPINSLLTIENSNSFHLGVFEGGTSGGLSYAFFSDYAQNVNLLPVSNHTERNHHFCVGDSLRLFIEDEELFTNITWTKPNGDIVSQNQLIIPAVALSDAGEYIVSADSDCPTTPKSIVISVDEYPETILEDSIFTCRENLTLNAGGTAYQYHWSTGEITPLIEVDQSGLYIVTISNSYCAISDSTYVDLSTLKITINQEGDLCVNGHVSLSVTSVGDNITWNTGETAWTISVDEPGTYTATVQLDNCSASESIYVKPGTLPLSISVSGNICDSPIATLTANTSTNNLFWSTGETTAAINIEEAGTYFVTATFGSCTTTDSISFRCNCSVWIPNSFSPTGDGHNEYFGAITSNELLFYHLQIYNRWGMLVFETFDLNRQWDGKYKDAESPMDIYYYILKYKCDIVDGEMITRKNSVLLAR